MSAVLSSLQLLQTLFGLRHQGPAEVHPEGEEPGHSRLPAQQTSLLLGVAQLPQVGWLLSPSSLCSCSSPSLSSAQPLPQHGRVQPVRAAGRRHAEAGRRGTQGQLLSGGHVLRLGILPPVRLHLTHAGGPRPELATRAVINHASLLSEGLCLDTGFESRLL